MSNIINADDFKRFRVASTFSEISDIRSISFHYNGEFLAYNTDTTLSILHLTVESIRKFDVSVAKRGCGIVKFFETDPMRLVHSSPDYSLRFLNAERVKYISYFTGHSKKVVNIELDDNFFFSSSQDKTIRMWDRLQQESVKRILCTSTPLIALHPSGYFLAVATKSSSIEFLDIRNLDNSIKKFKFEKFEGVEWTGMKFSPDGRMLIVTTNSTCILVFDTRDGSEKRNWKDYSNPGKDMIDACFTPDSKFVVAGSLEGFVHVWDVESSHKVHSMKSGYDGTCNNVSFNPKFMNLATTSADSFSSNLHLWIEK